MQAGARRGQQGRMLRFRFSFSALHASLSSSACGFHIQMMVGGSARTVVDPAGRWLSSPPTIHHVPIVITHAKLKLQRKLYN